MDNSELSAALAVNLRATVVVLEMLHSANVELLEKLGGSLSTVQVTTLQKMIITLSEHMERAAGWQSKIDGHLMDTAKARADMMLLAGGDRYYLRRKPVGRELHDEVQALVGTVLRPAQWDALLERGFDLLTDAQGKVLRSATHPAGIERGT